MNNYIITDGKKTYTRISKAAARHAYYENKNLCFCPVNLRPGSPWNPEILCNLENMDGRIFEQTINAFEFYNCANTETGKYTAFYIVTEKE